MQTIDHPTAQAWLAQLNQIAPTPQKKAGNRRWLIVVLALVIIDGASVEDGY